MQWQHNDQNTDRRTQKRLDLRLRDEKRDDLRLPDRQKKTSGNNHKTSKKTSLLRNKGGSSRSRKFASMRRNLYPNGSRSSICQRTSLLDGRTRLNGGNRSLGNNGLGSLGRNNNLLLSLGGNLLGGNKLLGGNNGGGNSLRGCHLCPENNHHGPRTG